MSTHRPAPRPFFGFKSLGFGTASDSSPSAKPPARLPKLPMRMPSDVGALQAHGFQVVQDQEH